MSAAREWSIDPASPISADAPDPGESDASRSRSLHSVPAPGVPTARRGPFVTLMLVLLGGGLTGLLLLNTQLQQGSFLLSNLQARAAELSDTAQSLGLQAAEMQAPQAIQSAAAALGMVPAGAPHFLDLTHRKLLGAPTVAGMPVILTPAQLASATAAAEARARAAQATAAQATAAQAKVAREKVAQAKAAAAARARAEASATAGARPSPTPDAKPTPSSPTKPSSTAGPTVRLLRPRGRPSEH